MRIVIDTNILVSAIFFGGKPQEVVELAFLKQITAVASPEIIEEYHDPVKTRISLLSGLFPVLRQSMFQGR